MAGDGAEMGAKQAEEGRVTSHSDTAGEGEEEQDHPRTVLKALEQV